MKTDGWDQSNSPPEPDLTRPCTPDHHLMTPKISCFIRPSFWTPPQGPPPPSRLPCYVFCTCMLTYTNRNPNIDKLSWAINYPLTLVLKDQQLSSISYTCQGILHHNEFLILGPGDKRKCVLFEGGGKRWVGGLRWHNPSSECDPRCNGPPTRPRNL